ncbi:MAG: 23S rRNA (guanosine(2251)-2'-O)-methyltransferase RlmB [Simkania sp.]|jgi:23S rRNA (guanosine2251-2'-O)-methyltransferase|uniref:Putative TrmH family tRNA/rRNA methyltransferase n=1 Tax=Simkania negevensis (strain ATCC VR-1471 / DSM 27360 / Z) TaxID=331113 RepID=F8L7Y0_SIMNZ|nr:23S rRNA (guanosine(2251)-2'-O)-methyltransferase RlmB [Simkania negevensis]MCB1067462.1 23S rRNA (guanosine(2251)-2'-O)-methyltransferase RlmB [Simkania sp.]MCB1082857.1 23S rRNA (guanosine(2251)-2'-O)-methyltransferase RlmB [Simkania sp.]MCP5490289.1 23S rRNA (guanosine(2251)-2'-O)-methyltransferase RlmB [Chlamydiales bacterium]CCB88882.1 putative TrmH family tRNA/rRNA methyltransferase [Simkania negevensis Z]
MNEEPLIMGKNCLSEVLKTNPKSIQKIFTSKEDDPVLKKAKGFNIPIQFVPKARLTAMVNSESHQGVVAKLRERTYPELRPFLRTSKEKSLILMCDGITDPQNFGAILRAAECFGVDGVVFSKNRSVEITPVVTKASVGASELVPLLRVSNLAETMNQFQKAGFTAIVADVGEHSKSIDTFTFPDKTLLILGAEGRGVQPLLKKKADCCVEIPLKGQIDSLNVSQAASILLFKARG